VSAERPAAPRIGRGQVWRERATGRLVAIAAVNARVVSLRDPERGEEAAIPDESFRARFEFAGLAVREPDPDAAPSAIEAATLRGLERRPTTWLRELLAAADGRGMAGLARLAHQALALRGESPGAREAGDG
jgi:hypothetical protein